MNPARLLVPAVYLLFAAWAGPARADALAGPFAAASNAYFVSVNGTPLWAHQPEQSLPPASLTKIMTALLVLEHGNLQRVVRISPAASRESGSRLGLKPGEKMRVAELLAAAILQSANDACHALAEHVAASEQAFVALMNRRASELGLHDTRFANACGHDHPAHRSSARDLARLAELALRHPGFARLVAQVEVDVLDTAGRRHRLINSNQLIGRYPGAIGVKTGYTRQAGKCLIALAVRGERRVLLVLLNAPDRWWTASAMLDRAFAETVPVQASSHAP
ncbi:MAG: D-alanyl-D-alanine carboxypeptidase family protein [Sulfurimicrobium sp.]|nr:D-alanyl-D-alanine carboxypeptidase family protein [Sulfurimicrobium sp.]